MYKSLERARLRLRRDFRSNRHGGIATTSALVLIPISLAIGVAIDLSRGASAKSDMQNSLDAAALAAAKPSGISAAERQKIGARHFEALYAGKFGGVVPKTKFQVGKGRLVASSSGYIPTTFMRLGGKSSLNISTRTVVMLNSPVAGACVVFKTFSIGGSLRIDPKCGFHTYDKSPAPFRVYGSFANYNTDVSTAGGFQGRAWNKPVKQGVPPGKYSDPLGGSGKIRNTGCKDNGSPIVVNAGDRRTIRPGTYCRKLVLNGGELHLRPGIYVLHKEIEVKDQASITGFRVAMVFAKKARFNIDVDGKGTGLDIHATAPRSGQYKNILIYQAPSAAGNINHINGSLEFTHRFTGLVYLPDQDININGAFAFKTRKPAVIVARDVKIRGAMHIYLPDDSLTSRISGKTGTPYLLQ